MTTTIDIETITPELARAWLEDCNDNNRDMRPSHIEALRKAFARGEYVQTHQGIAFDEDGNIVDGQHRLSAIGLLPEGWECQMMVTRGMDRGATYPVIDTTSARRSVSDALRVPRDLGECATFLAKVYTSNTTGSTPLFISQFVHWVTPEQEEMMAFCPRKVKTWSSAPVRAAALVAMKMFDRAQVKQTYSALIYLNFDAMPDVAKALTRGAMNGSIRSDKAVDIFCRSLKALDPRNAGLRVIKLTAVERTEMLGALRILMDTQIFNRTKPAMGGRLRVTPRGRSADVGQALIPAP